MMRSEINIGRACEGQTIRTETREFRRVDARRIEYMVSRQQSSRNKSGINTSPGPSWSRRLLYCNVVQIPVLGP